MLNDILKEKVIEGKKPMYTIKNGINIYISDYGYHFIDYLDEDDNDSICETIDDGIIEYIEKYLQYNEERPLNHKEMVLHYFPTIEDKRVIDIGCGGGKFLSLLQKNGAKVIGIELDHKRAYYAEKVNNIDVVKKPIEDVYWQKKSDSFDVVTLWDVIEHVNYPIYTLKKATELLKDDGYLFIDTPCRDCFYYKIGELTYSLSKGKFPTFLNIMYSDAKYAHKQILSTSDMVKIFKICGLEIVKIEKIHELSFPYSFYLKKIFRSKKIADLISPLVKLLFKIFPIRNKMVIVGKKVSS